MKKQLLSVSVLLFALLFVAAQATAQTTSIKKASPTDKKRVAAKAHYTKKTSTTTAKVVSTTKSLPKPAATPSKEEFTSKGGSSSTSSRTGALQFKNTHYDFGTIKDGETFDYKFEFVNTGSKAISILDAKASCGCTVPDYPFVPIEPGEKGVIGVHYNSKTKAGQQHPLVTVTTDAPSTFQLHLEGFVETKLIPFNKN
jgi:uncharacterized protein (DUF2147 family)